MLAGLMRRKLRNVSFALDEEEAEEFFLWMKTKVMNDGLVIDEEEAKK